MNDGTVGNLRDGGTYRATAYSLELRNADGTVRQTIDANDIRTVQRRDTTVNVQMKKGRPVAVETATLDDAGRLVATLQPTSSNAPAAPRRGGVLGSIAKYGCLLPLVVVGGLVVLVIVFVLLAVGGSDDVVGGEDVRVALREGSNSTVTSAGETHKVTITEITDNPTSENQFAQPAAGMRYWVAFVEVENVDNEEIYAGDWKLRTSDNSEFTRTFAAGLEALGQDYSIAQNLTPGGRTAGKVVFQIPADVSVTFLRYEGNPFAPGDLYFEAE